MTTRRDFVKTAGAAALAGTVGFPVSAFAWTRSRLSTTAANASAAVLDGTASAVATNGYLLSLLPLEDRVALRNINIRLTDLAIQQCAPANAVVANQILFDTLICESLLEFAAHGVFPDDLRRLARDFDVVFPWSAVYGDARTPYNMRFVRLPLIIAFPRTVDHVVFWVNFVRDHHLSVSIRSGGNSYEAFSSDNDVILDLTFLTLGRTTPAEQIRLDLGAGVVHVASGVRFGPLYTEIGKQGVTLAAGQCSQVCPGGFVGTGGVGFAARAFGYGGDQLVEVEYVLADGRVVVANAGNQFADLYRASKGAGAAGLGVMTRLTLRVVPAVTVLFYAVTFDLEDGAVVLANWQNLAATAPDALSSIAAASSSSTGQALLVINGEFRVESGSVAAARTTLTNVLRTQWLDRLPAPLNQTPIGIVEMTTLEAATAVALEVPMPVFNQWKLKSNFVFRQLTAAEFQPIIDFLRTHAPSDDPTRAAGFLNLLLMGGASNRIDPNSAVIPAREGTVAWFHAGALWNDQSLEPQGLAFTEALWAVMTPILQSQTAQLGCPDRQLGSQLSNPPDLRYLRAYWASPTHDFVPFLLAVKRRYDPLDVFQFAQSIPVPEGLA
jgi:hypothetical protein